jgi:hypothetical protein
MKDILQNLLGVGDGAGNTSFMRVGCLLVLMAVLIPKVVGAVKSGVPFEFTSGDLEVLGLVFGAKLVQNYQESKTPATPPQPAAPTATDKPKA